MLVRNTFLMAALYLAGPATSGAAEPAGPSPLQARAREIEPWLPPTPIGMGRPASDRAAWETVAPRPGFAAAVSAAASLAKEPLAAIPDDLFLEFSKTGNRTHWQSAAGRRNARLETFTLAECTEYRGRFLPPLEEVIRALCADRTWVMPAHDSALTNFKGTSTDIDLSSASLAWRLATVDYLLGDRLGAETRGLLRSEVRRRVLVPYRDMAEGKRKPNWWMLTTNNWNAVCLAGVTGAAMALVETPADRAFYAAAAESYVQNFLKGFTPDGYCSEGLGYWDYGFGHFVLLAECLYQATGGKLDLLQQPEARAPAGFGAGIEIQNDVYPAFADCGVTARPDRRTMFVVSRRLGLGLTRWEDPAAVNGPGGALYETALFAFANSATAARPAPAAAGPGLRTWFDQAGILISRPAPGSACRLAAALKGGHNAEHHNHNDLGSYTLVLGRRPLLLDPGAEEYTARTFSSRRYESKVLNSYGHPVPVIAGKLQRPGAEARAKVVRTEFTDEADTLVLDIRSGYDVPELKTLTRTFRYSRAGTGSLTVTDEFEFATPQTFATALVTMSAWQQTGPAAGLVFDVDEALKIEIDTQGAEADLRTEEIHEEVHASSLPLRIGVDLRQPQTAGRVVVTLTPAALPADGHAGLLRNGGFENGALGWSIPRDGISERSNAKAASGQWSLHITDNEPARGSSVTSARVAAGPGAYELRGKVFPVSGDGVGVYVRCLDADGQFLNTAGERNEVPPVLSLGGTDNAWKPFSGTLGAPAGTVALEVWIHSFNASKVEAFLDDLELVPAAAAPAAKP